MIKRILTFIARMKKTILIFVVGIVFAIVCFLTINVTMKPFSTNEFCGSKCHFMNTSYQTWELSKHGSNNIGYTVDCIDCHLPPKDKYFTHLIVKGYKGAKDFYKYHTLDHYDPDEMSKTVAEHFKNETCLHCHDNLLAKPANSIVQKAHQPVLLNPDAPESKCITCHENIAHQRATKLFE